MTRAETTRDRLVARLAAGSIGVCVLILVGTLAFPFVRHAVGAPAPRAGYAVGDRVDVPAEVYARPAVDRDHLRAERVWRLPADEAGARPGDGGARGHAVDGGGRGGAAVESAAPSSSSRARLASPRAPTLLDLGTLRLQMVPTVLVVDRRGDVQFVRAGGGWSAADEGDFVRTVRALGAGR